MPAARTNYLVLFKGDSQVYASGSKEVAMATPPPSGFLLEDKMVLFVTCEPDSNELVVRPLPKEEVMNAEITEKKKANVKDKQD